MENGTNEAPDHNRPMAHRVTLEVDGEEYWADVSNDLRDKAVNYAMSEGVDMQAALGDVLASRIVSVEEK